MEYGFNSKVIFQMIPFLCELTRTNSNSITVDDRNNVILDNSTPADELLSHDNVVIRSN